MINCFSLGQILILRDTEQAILVDYKGNNVWVPKSQVDKDSPLRILEKGEMGELWVSSWFAEKKGWA